LSAGTETGLPEAAAHHLRRVLRLRDGHPLRVFDGAGAEFDAELLSGGRIRLGEARTGETESPLSVTLVQGISRGQRMDYALQKAVELGVARIVPVFCERSVVRLDGARLDRRMVHWSGVIASACEQSGRRRLPALEPAIGIAELLAAGKAGDGLRLYLDPEAGAGLRTIKPTGQLSLLIGPEGGLDTVEIEGLESAGWRGLHLGPRVLRTETAGVAALAVVQALWGDLA
jgi:16S rRNA (uracil1498-N3)-methyltransferase